MSEISDLIKKLAGTFDTDTVHLIECTVNSVDEEDRICECTPLSDSFEGTLESVYLSAQPNDGIIQIPVIGSIVKVCICNSIDYPFIIQFSDLEKVIMLAETSIQLNNGAFEGLVKVVELTEKINALEDDINTLKQAFSSWIVVPNDGGLALKTSSASWAGQTITLTQQAEIENTSITHG